MPASFPCSCHLTPGQPRRRKQAHTPRSHSAICCALGRSAGSAWVAAAKMWAASGGAPSGIATTGASAAAPLACGQPWSDMVHCYSTNTLRVLTSLL